MNNHFIASIFSQMANIRNYCFHKKFIYITKTILSTRNNQINEQSTMVQRKRKVLNLIVIQWQCCSLMCIHVPTVNVAPVSLMGRTRAEYSVEFSLAKSNVRISSSLPHNDVPVNVASNINVRYNAIVWRLYCLTCTTILDDKCFRTVHAY